MKKCLVSIILTVFLVLSMMPFAAFADNAIVCPACGGEVTKKPYHLVGNYWDFYKCNTCGKWAYLSGVAGLKLLSAGDQAIINAADANAILNFAFQPKKPPPASAAKTCRAMKIQTPIPVFPRFLKMVILHCLQNTVLLIIKINLWIHFQSKSIMIFGILAKILYILNGIQIRVQSAIHIVDIFLTRIMCRASIMFPLVHRMFLIRGVMVMFVI